jgi:hypothetical protein
MKKLLLTIGLLSAVAVVSSYGQGTVVFGNTGGTRISTNSGPTGVTGVGLVAANATQSFYYALFYSTTQTTVGGVNANVLGTNGVYAFNSVGWNNGSLNGYSTNTAAGRLQPSNPNADQSAGVSGLAGGTSAHFVIVGWSSNIGSDVSGLSAYLANPTVTGWVGESLVSGAIVPGTLGSTAASGIFGAAPAFIPGFTLGEVAAVPEPGTLALAALGGASLLLFRRKN